jgi:hypothetical protein
MAISKVVLSGSTDGKPIVITTTESPGDLIHTASATEIDEIWIYLSNTSSASVVTTIQWGLTTTAGSIIQNVPGQAGLYLAVPGLVLTNSGTVRAFASVSDVIAVFGFVNRIFIT